MILRHGILLATLLTLVTGATHAQDAKPTPTALLQRLKDGNARFVADQPAKHDAGSAKRKELAKGQHPFAVVLTCADSRVAPEVIFDAGLGEIFVLRVAGNIADPAVVGSIEYAVEEQHVPLIVVLGHESCGAVAAAVVGKPIPGDLGWLVKQVKIGKDLPAGGDAKMYAAVHHNARAVAADIALRSRVIHDQVKSKKVLIVPAFYSLKTGKVDWLLTPTATELNLKGASGQVALKAGFLPDPFTADVQAGGDAQNDTGGVKAWIAKAPNYRLNYTTGQYPLTFKVECSKDTTLLIRTPDGKFHANDDQSANNLNPLIRFANPKSGAYDIWVGVFNKNDTPRAKLQITER